MYNISMDAIIGIEKIKATTFHNPNQQRQKNHFTFQDELVKAQKKIGVVNKVNRDTQLHLGWPIIT